MASLPPISRLPRLRAVRPMRAVPVDPVDLRLLHQMLLANLALGIWNLIATLWLR